MTFPSVDPLFKFTTIPDADDYSIHVDKDNCPRFGAVDADVKASQSNIISQQQIADLFEAEYFPHLRELTEMPDADTDTMFDVANYLYWANLSSLNLKFELSEWDLNWIYASVVRGVWNKYNAVHEQVDLSMFELMHQLYELSEVVLGADFREQPYFMEYFTGN